MSKYFIGAKVIIAIVLILTGYRFFNELDNNSILLSSISVDVADIKNTMASFSRQIASDERSIAKLQGNEQ
jgi:hypothetical protein